MSILFLKYHLINLPFPLISLPLSFSFLNIFRLGISLSYSPWKIISSLPQFRCLSYLLMTSPYSPLYINLPHCSPRSPSPSPLQYPKSLTLFSLSAHLPNSSAQSPSPSPYSHPPSLSTLLTLPFQSSFSLSLSLPSSSISPRPPPPYFPFPPISQVRLTRGHQYSHHCSSPPITAPAHHRPFNAKGRVKGSRIEWDRLGR